MSDDAWLGKGWTTEDATSWLDRRKEGQHCIGGRGSGKSIFLGMSLAMDDARANIPVVIFDPSGDTIDNFLHQVLCQEADERKQLMSRIRYVNMAGKLLHGGSTEGWYYGRKLFDPPEMLYKPFPIYFQYSKDDSDDIVAGRFVEALRRLYPELERAQVQGMPWVQEAGMIVGQELFRRGLQLDAADIILDNPDYIPKGKGEQFKLRVREILRNDVLRKIYTTSTPYLDWRQVFEDKAIVLLDFRDLRPPTSINHRFAFIWSFWYLIDFLDKRGANFTEPISIILDELKALTIAGTPERQQVFANDLDYILNTLCRQRNIWLTVAHQQMTQFSPHVQSLLMGMGTQMVGRLETREDAEIVSEELVDINPHKIKRHDEIYGSSTMMAGGFIETRFGDFSTAPITEHDVIGYREVNYTPEEQKKMNARIFLNLPLQQFRIYQRGSTKVTNFKFKNSYFLEEKEGKYLRGRLFREGARAEFLPQEQKTPAAGTDQPQEQSGHTAEKPPLVTDMPPFPFKRKGTIQ